MADYLGSVFTLKWEETPGTTPVVQHTNLVASGSLEAAIVSLALEMEQTPASGWTDTSEVFYGSRNGKYHDTLIDELGAAPVTMEVSMVNAQLGDDVYPNRISAYAGTIVPIQVAFGGGSSNTTCVITQGGTTLLTFTNGDDTPQSITLQPDAVGGTTAILVATFST